MESQPNRPPGLRDVAKHAGVSHQTVSRVLNNHPGISRATRDRVQRAVAELRYRPNRAARALATNRSRSIGILASNRAQYGPASSIHAIEVAAQLSRYSVVTANLAATDDISVGRALAHLMDQSVEGLILIAPELRMLDAIERLAPAVPWVTLQSSRRAGGPLPVEPSAGARMATQHLIDLGHTRIVHVAGPSGWIEADARVHGFQTEMIEHGLPALAPLHGDWSVASGYRAGRELLDSLDVTAVFSANDEMALGLLHAAHERGLRVPGDISIIGFDDIPQAEHYWPPLTTIRQDFSELGERCIALLIATIEDREFDPLDIIPTLVLRASSAPPDA